MIYVKSGWDAEEGAQEDRRPTNSGGAVSGEVRAGSQRGKEDGLQVCGAVRSVRVSVPSEVVFECLTMELELGSSLVPLPVSTVFLISRGCRCPCPIAAC